MQGEDQHRVASLWLFPPPVPLFADRSDTAAQYYASFRRRHTGGVLLNESCLQARASGSAAAASRQVDTSITGLRA